MSVPTYRVVISGILSRELADYIVEKFPEFHEGQPTGLRVRVVVESMAQQVAPAPVVS